MEGLSDAAKQLLLDQFSQGEASTHTSTAPHHYVLSNRAVFDELISKQIITVKQTGNGTFVYIGTPRALEIAHEIMKETHL